MTLEERVAAYATSPEGVRFPDSIPRVGPTGKMMVGHWVLGQDYRSRSGLYGSYPPRYLTRVLALFPRVRHRRILHIFSGSVPVGPWTRVDISLQRSPRSDICADAEQLPIRRGAFYLVLADPPYLESDALKYGTAFPNKKRAMEEIASILHPGGQLVWLDQTRPMYRKSDWRWWGSITIIRSTNHRVREAFFFERRKQ